MVSGTRTRAVGNVGPAGSHFAPTDRQHRGNVDMRAADWDTVVVLVNAGYWWWNAWRERTATELSGTAGTRGEAATAMERAITGVGRPTDQLGPRRERP